MAYAWPAYWGMHWEVWSSSGLRKIYGRSILTAVSDALWHLLHATESGAGVIDTVMRDRDTDTNAAICGALHVAVHGL